jgi:hypothetical protein
MSWGPRRGVSAMHRSSRRRSARRSDSRSTAHATARTPSTNLIAVPDGARPLSEGLVVEASVVARLLRIRLLAIDATLIVAPAHVQGRTRTAAQRFDATLAPAMPPTRGRAIGAGLAAAEQILNEGAASLATSRA